MANVDPFEQFQNQILGEALGVNDFAGDGGIDIQYLQRLPQEYRAIYLENLGVKGTQMTNIMKGMEAADESQESLGNARKYRDTLVQLGANPYDEDLDAAQARMAAVSGPVTSIFTGGSENDPSIRQRLGRLANSAFGPEGTSSAQDARDALLSQDYIKAYDDLRGAGQITEYEGKTAAAAESRFAAGNLNDEEFREYAQNFYKTLDAGIKRREANIYITSTGAEIMRDGATGNPIGQVVSLYDRDTGQLNIVRLGDLNTPVPFPRNYPMEEIERQFNVLPEGQRFTYYDASGNLVEAVKTNP